MTSITFPTGLKSKYTYESAKMLGKYYKRLTSREYNDGQKSYNKETYTYSNTNYTGYIPDGGIGDNKYEYYICVKDGKGLETKYIFNEYNLNTKVIKTNTSVSSKPVEEEIGNIYLRNRYYDPEIGRFNTQDPARSGLNWYTYCSNNPLSFIDPNGLEQIVVSGGVYSSGNSRQGYRYNFIEPAIKKISEIRGQEIENAKGIPSEWENITWIIANEGWTDEDLKNFQTVADGLLVNLVKIKSSDELVNYINTKGITNTNNISSSRLDDKITSFTVFSHGLEQDDGIVSLGYNYTSTYNSKLNIKINDISKISGNAFSSAISEFYSCNTGTAYEKSFAYFWHKQTRGSVVAFAGTTDYHNIMYPKGYLRENPLYWLDRTTIRDARKNYGFSAWGSFNYPGPSKGINAVYYY